MIAIDNLQKMVARALIGLALFHVMILVIVAALFDYSAILVGGVALLFAGVPVLLTVLRRPPRMVGFSLTVALVSQTALLVSIFAGHPWQVEMHFYFFAVLAMFAGFCDIWILIAAATMIIVHHLLFNGLIPDFIYPGGGNMMRLGVHVCVVVIETSMLVNIARVIRGAFDEVSTAKATASHLADVGTTLKEKLNATTERANYFETSLGAFRTEIAQSLEKLGAASKTLDETADDFSTVILQTTARAKAVATTAETANLRVGKVASAGRAYVGTMSAISDHTLVSARMGKAAVCEAESTAATIQELTRMSNRIDTATKLIAAIANQTNLLALNATIEAARAGEHGRGFSVVAGEVKSLASETTRVLATISEMVNGIKSSTHRSAGAMSSILTAIHGLNSATATIADAIEERVSGAAHMSSDVDAAAEDVRKVATAVEAIENVTGESAKGAGSVRLAASEIAEQTESIRRHVESFVADMTVLHESADYSNHPVGQRSVA